MKEKRLATVLVATALAGICFGQEPPAPLPAVPQAATDAEGLAAARARLAELKALPAKTSLLCGSSLQFPYYHFAVMPSHSPRDMGDQWNMSFGLLAPYAQGNADLAVEMFAEGASILAQMDDDETRQELVRQFQSFGEQAIERTSQALCKDKPDQVVPYLKQLIATKAVTAQFGDRQETLPASPLTSVRPEFLGELVRNLQPALMGDGADAKNVRAFEAVIIDFLADDGIPPDVRDALLDTLLAPAFARAGADADAFRQLLADARGLRVRLPNEASQASLDQRIQSFGERLVDQTYQSLGTNTAAEVAAYLKQLVSTKAFVIRFGDAKDLVTVKADGLPALRKDFLGQLVAKAYPRIADVNAPLAEVKAADGLVLQLLGEGLANETTSALVDAFADKSIARAQNTLAGARQFVETAEKIRAALGEGDLRDNLDRRCRQFARKATVKTFRGHAHPAAAV